MGQLLFANKDQVAQVVQKLPKVGSWVQVSPCGLEGQVINYTIGNCLLDLESLSYFEPTQGRWFGLLEQQLRAISYVIDYNNLR